jgi:excisionase family DNA binding protein
LTTREVAHLLGLSAETVLRRWRRGEIPGGIRLASNVLRFRASAIDEWLDALERIDEVRTAAHTPGVRDCATDERAVVAG